MWIAESKNTVVNAIKEEAIIEVPEIIKRKKNSKESVYFLCLTR